MTKSALKALVSALLLLASEAALAAREVNLPPPATEIAQMMYDLHTTIMWIIVVIFVVVFGAMFYAVLKHRKSLGHQAAHFHENTTVEIVWTVIPLLILLVMAVPATKGILAMKDTSEPDMTIKVTGYQWKWGYDYIKGEGEGIKFLSQLSTPWDQIYSNAPKGENYLLEVDNPLVVPVGKKVRVILTANDVIHAWWVPAFGVKQDAIPGFVRDTWFKADRAGTFRGNCAELCGKEHGFMPIVVEALEPEKYTQWVAERTKVAQAGPVEDPNKTYSKDELMAKGAEVFTKNCVACHMANGKGMPPTFPALDGGKITTGPKAGHIDIVTNGSSKNPSMMAWGKTLTDLDVAAVITYERNSWGNKTGDIVQPAEVKAAKK
jgi:cytochrome c oxidase subunit 2